MNRVIILLVIVLILLLLDFYTFQGVRAATQNFSTFWQRANRVIFWGATALVIISMILFMLFRGSGTIPMAFTAMATVSIGSIIGKLIYAILLFLDDIRRGVQWAITKLTQSPEVISAGEPITRSEFLSQAGGITATIPVLTMSYGIMNGAHDYRVRERTLWINDMPKAFDGMKLLQLSDIHTGSFWSKKAVQKGMDLIKSQKADMVFFTGDIVNNRADELKGWTEVFEKIQAPLGVYSTLGNHDYGDYVQWNSTAEKNQNLQNVMRAHKEMGWDLMRNEHRKIRVDNEELVILGVENWSDKGRFPKYGDLDKALENTEKGQPKLLLSHDPSHWRAQILGNYKDIKGVFSGHTHGMQFGVEIGGFRWSPVKYMYPEWADLYTEGDQNLYVNRGFGYIGYPGRIGILPEITVFTLKSGDPSKA